MPARAGRAAHHGRVRRVGFRVRPSGLSGRQVGVDCLASKWGVRETLTGKTAWAELDVQGEPGPQPR
jgi:ribosomal protein L34